MNHLNGNYKFKLKLKLKCFSINFFFSFSLVIESYEFREREAIMMLKLEFIEEKYSPKIIRTNTRDTYTCMMMIYIFLVKLNFIPFYIISTFYFLFLFRTLKSTI